MVSSLIPTLTTNDKSGVCSPYSPPDLLIRHGIDAGIQLQSIQRSEAHERARELHGHRVRRISPSSAGGCQRKAILQTLVEDRQEFDVPSLDRMQQGDLLETNTASLLNLAYPYRVTHESLPDPVWASIADDVRSRGGTMPGEPVSQERVWLGNQFFSGYCDIILDHVDNPMRNPATPPIIIEHKAQGQRWFDYQEKSPSIEHVVQLALYGVFYEHQYGIRPRLVLFQRAWNDWAEFEVTIQSDVMLACGVVHAKNRSEHRERVIDVDIHELMTRLETWYTMRETQLPPILPKGEQEGNCFRRRKPWCPFVPVCYPGT